MKALRNSIPIYKIQGSSAYSSYDKTVVHTSGVVIGEAKHGFFIQDPRTTANPPSDSTGCSHGIFVYMRGQKPPEGCLLELEAEVVDYTKSSNDKPVTQLHMRDATLIDRNGPSIKPFELTSDVLFGQRNNLPEFLNALEGMRVMLAADATFIQASNPFGDYVVLPKNCDLEKYFQSVTAAKHAGFIFCVDDFECWLPSFKLLNINEAPKINVGAILETAVTGPLYFRSGSYQLSVNHPIKVKNQSIALESTQLKSQPNAITVMTLNCLNLDVNIEAADRVKNPDTDIDDDVGSGQFRLLAQAVVQQALSPDVIALQEIQDNDGAEQTTVVSAAKTYEELISAIKKLGGPEYSWVDINPSSGLDGGQPGGNIRNGFLYNAARVSVVENSLKRIGEQAEAFDGSRKPLVASFKLIKEGQVLTIINVHLASKRHQNSIFSPENPGFDSKLVVRVEQANLIKEFMDGLLNENNDCYVTGDFNDLLGSETLRTLLGESYVNLVEMLDKNDRYDYNHRGKLHVLMHGIVSKGMYQQGRAEYEILHGNELLGVKPGQLSGKASDHAYVIARISG